MVSTLISNYFAGSNTFSVARNTARNFGTPPFKITVVCRNAYDNDIILDRSASSIYTICDSRNDVLTIESVDTDYGPDQNFVVGDFVVLGYLRTVDRYTWQPLVSDDIDVGPNTIYVNRISSSLTYKNLSSVSAPLTSSAYVHDQSIAASTWTVNHNLGKYPSVTVIDTAGTQVIGDVHYNSINVVTLTFTSPFSGKAFIN